MGTEHNTMSSAPVYSRNLNGMMAGAYSNADLRMMVQADKPQAVAVPATMAFDVHPQRGDMLRIQHRVRVRVRVRYLAAAFEYSKYIVQLDALIPNILAVC